MRLAADQRHRDQRRYSHAAVFWMNEARTVDEIKDWLEPYLKSQAADKKDDPKRVIDGAIYSPSQPIYAARPVIEEGAYDPVQGDRIGLLPGVLTVVDVPE